MDIAQLATELLSDQLGGSADSESLQQALSGLLGDGQGEIDLAGLAGKMSSSGELGDIVNSWLGDGANAPISADSLAGLLDEGQLADFASSLGIDSQSAADTLANVLPQVMDKASSGGSLLDSLGGMDGLLDSAKSFLS